VPPQAPITVSLNVSAVVTLSAFGVIQHASSATQFTAGTSGTATASFPKKTTAGNCLVACVSIWSAALTFALASVKTNGLAENWTTGITSSSGISYILADPGTGGGQTTIDVAITFSAASTSDSVAVLIDIFEVLSSGNIDQLAAIQQTGGSFTETIPPTTAAPEILFSLVFADNGGSFNTPFTIAGSGLPWNLEPQVNSSVQDGGLGTGFQIDMAQVSGWRVLNSQGTATFSGTVTPAANVLTETCILTLSGILPGAGAGTAQIGPVNHREVWSPEVISVSVSTAVNQASCNIYAGPDTSQANFVDNTLTGSTGFSTYPTASRVVRAGEYVFAVWSGGDGGQQARVNIQGTKVIGSGGPPGWTHVRTRKLG